MVAVVSNHLPTSQQVGTFGQWGTDMGTFGQWGSYAIPSVSAWPRDDCCMGGCTLLHPVLIQPAQSTIFSSMGVRAWGIWELDTQLVPHCNLLPLSLQVPALLHCLY